MDQNDSQNINHSEELTLAELVIGLKSWVSYIKSKWFTILFISAMGALLGFGYSYFKKPTYTAVCTFVLEDSKSGGGMSQYAGIAALAGINLSSGGGGIFQGDNIIELYTSRLMIEKTLLSPYNFSGKRQLLIDRFVDSYKLRDRWKSEDGIQKIDFNGNPDNFNRKQDSLITDLADFIDKKILNVSKPDKKLSIIRVEVETKDELFSKYFTEKLVQNVNDFYVQTKTKKADQNVRILQHQADSVRSILNSSINGVASAIDEAPNANPQIQMLRVNSQKKQIDVQANSAIYSEIVKNLELEKISLRQETPLIQIVDRPVLPLSINHITILKGVAIGLLVGFIFILIFLILKKIYKSLMESV